MKRTLLAGTFFALAGAVSLLLLASIIYSCRSGGDPHHEQATQDAAPEGTRSEAHSMRNRPAPPEGIQLTFAQVPPSPSAERQSSKAASAV